MTSSDRPARVLVITDHSEATPDLLAAIRARAAQGPALFRVLVPNPARAEAHLHHLERHEKAEAAEQVLHNALPAFRDAAGSPVLGSVSIRHDPFDAIEETLRDEPIDEFIVAIAPHGLSKMLHQDLVHRLAHFGLPVSSISP